LATVITSGKFTAHNIVLPDGTQTKPGTAVLAGEPIAQTAMLLARAFCPPAPGRRVVDLGCLEGGYTAEFAKAGYETVGIDARAENIARCEFVRDHIGLDGLSFMCDDVRNLRDHMAFDIAFCCGLLYHLDQPMAFLRLLGDQTTRLLILHTHYAEMRRNPSFWLGALTVHEGVRGRWLREVRRTGLRRVADKAFGSFYRSPYGASWRSRDEMEDKRWASWDNTASFWPLKEHLLSGIRGAGFQYVFEIYGADEIPTDGQGTGHRSRGMFVGVKD
jgi:SAM-dependent methyltransferase